MKKIFTSLLMLFHIFCSAQNDSIRKPVECGTGRVMQLLDKDRQKTIQDFITHYKEDANYGLMDNGLWMTIGKQNTDEDILKEGLKGYDWKNDNILILKSLDEGDFRYILFSHQKDGERAFQTIGMYHKTAFSFRVYDAFYWKNYQHPEILGEWKMSNTFSPKGNRQIRLEKTNVELEFGGALEIKEDYSFVMYDRCGYDCHSSKSIKGKYSFDAEGKISFNCNDIQYLGKKKEGKPFVSGPFKFTIENGVLILKK